MEVLLLPTRNQGISLAHRTPGHHGGKFCRFQQNPVYINFIHSAYHRGWQRITTLLILHAHSTEFPAHRAQADPAHPGRHRIHLENFRFRQHFPLGAGTQVPERRSTARVPPAFRHARRSPL